MSLLDEAASVSTELGMRPLMERVATLQERAEEVEVLRLIASGKTKRQVKLA